MGLDLMAIDDPDPSEWVNGLQRRAALALLSASIALPLGGWSAAVAAQTDRLASWVEVFRAWRQTGGVLLMRHAATQAGLGDPPGFVIGQCPTQRNLSEVGRHASRALGAWLQTQNFAPDVVRTSQWCRCQETAALAFGGYENWPALNSTFDSALSGPGGAAAQQQALRARLQALPDGRTEVWVTHQVIMTGLTGAFPGMGEGFVVDRQGRVLRRGDLAA